MGQLRPPTLEAPRTERMAETIYKFELKPNKKGLVAIDMPTGARVLSIQVQKGVPQIWALVNPDLETAPRTFYVPGTGHEHSISSGRLDFIGTFQLSWMVWHVFEVSR